MVGVLVRLEVIGVVASNLARAISSTYKDINNISTKGAVIAKATARY